MKQQAWLFVLVVLGIELHTPCFGKPRDPSLAGSGIGFALSGAGARISQHAAMMEVLVKGLYPGGTPLIPDYVAGASSGAMSAVALSAILENLENNSTGLSWEQYREIIWNLTTSDIYDNSVLGIAKILTVNIFEGHFLDNSHFRLLVESIISQIGYKALGDLYIPTCITVVNQSSGMDERLCSWDPKYSGLNLVDVIMASAALPMAFPPVIIPGMGDTIWIDGGTGIDTIPVYPLIENPNVKEVYIICYGSALTDGGASLPWYLDHILLLKNAMSVINDMRVDLFAGAIDIAKHSPKPAFSYIPSLNQSFTALNFDDEKQEWTETYNWAIANNPTPIN